MELSVSCSAWTLRHSAASGFDVYERFVEHAFSGPSRQVTVVAHDRLPRGLAWGDGLPEWVDFRGVVGESNHHPGLWSVPIVRADGRCTVSFLPPDVVFWIAYELGLPLMLQDGTYVAAQYLARAGNVRVNRAIEREPAAPPRSSTLERTSQEQR
jgi:hypothetical protein